MKNLFLVTAVSFLTLTFTITSCKKSGCTDELATNYFSDIKKDDGSCSYSSTKMEGKYLYTWNDTITDTATVYSYEKSHMKVEGPEFDFQKTNFIFLITWSTKNMHMPDSLVPALSYGGLPGNPYIGTVDGTIVSKDNFTITYVQEIPTWNNPSVKKDTILRYNFTRI